MTKILLVCMGNICRSPMALAVAQALAARFGLSNQFTFDSAGTHAHHAGERPDPRAVRALARRNYAADQIRSRRISTEDFKRFDLILAMDSDNLQTLREKCPPEYAGKLRLFMDFSPDHNTREVPDPYYGNAEGFERVLDLCESGAHGLLNHLKPK